MMCFARVAQCLSRNSSVKAIRELVLQDVDSKVTEKVDALWARGRQMLCQIQQKHLETTQQLTEEVTRCLEKQQAQEAENERLRQHLHDMATRFSMLGHICSGVSLGAVSSGVTEALASGSHGPGATENQESGILTPPISVAVRGGDGASSSSCSPTPPSVSATSSSGAGGHNCTTSAAAGVAALPEVPAFPLPTSLPVSPEPWQQVTAAAAAASALATSGGAN